MAIPDTIDQMWDDVDDDEGKQHLACRRCLGEKHELGAEVTTLCGKRRKIVSMGLTNDPNKCEKCVVLIRRHGKGKCS